MEYYKTLICITKVGKDTHLKHHVNNLLSFTRWLDEKHPDWRYFNVFDKESEQQITSYTKNKRPKYKMLIK